jgi:hypothetical protein
MALTNWLPSSMLSAASREPLGLAEMAHTRYPHLMTANRFRGIWIYNSAAPKCH